MRSRSAFRVVSLPFAIVEIARRTLTDPLGHSLRVTTQLSPVPCRFTLRQMPPGEELILMSYSPFHTEHPYKETGPIFICASGDTGYTDIHRWPPEIDPRQRVFRAYNAAEEIADAEVGTDDPDSLIARLFSNPLVDCIHVRALTYGCFTFKITRD
jgi:hypothetical protein